MRKVAFLAIPALAITLLAGPASADGDKPGGNDDPRAGSNTAAEIMAAQAPLVAAAARLIELDSEGNLGGIYLLVERRTLNLWWKGEVPGEIREEIERLQSEAGIRISVRYSEYSQRELNAVVQEVRQRWEAYPTMTSIGPLYDGSGLVATGKSLDPSMFPLPVIIEPDNTTIIQTSRTDDFAPWWAGGRTRVLGTNGAFCSTGFAVARYNLFGELGRGILTAEHCAPGGGVQFTDGVGEMIGLSEWAPALRDDSDSLLIRTQSQARMFDGGVGVGEFSKPVIGSVGNLPGQFVCTSGAATGVHCNIKTDGINKVVKLEPSGMIVSGVVLGTEQAGTVATGPGDSGGPVFTLAADPNKVLAAGLMTGGKIPVACQISGQTGCLNQVAFVDISYVLLAQGAALLNP